MTSINTGKGSYQNPPISEKQMAELQKRRAEMMALSPTERKEALKAEREAAEEKKQLQDDQIRAEQLKKEALTRRARAYEGSSKETYPIAPSPFKEQIAVAQQNAKDSYDNMKPAERNSYPVDKFTTRQNTISLTRLGPPLWTDGLEDTSIITQKEPPTEAFNQLA